MERRLERWFFECRSRKAVLASHPQPRLRIPGGQCLVSKTHVPLTLILDAAYPQHSTFQSGIWLRINRISLPSESSDSGLCPKVGQGDNPDRKQSFKRGAVG